MYDYLIVGAGWFGAIAAHELAKRGKSVVVIDRRSHVGGNCYTENVDGISVHRYGAHIFHTNSEKVWSYVNRFARFNRYTNSPLANYKGTLYNLPFNMNTFHTLWGVSTPEEAKAVIERQRIKTDAPRNLEEQALSLVGADIHEKLVKGYTQKQWGRACSELPAFIIKRLPLRFTYDNNYFNDRFQGIPVGGYTPIFNKLLEGIEVRLNTAYEKGAIAAKRVIYCGAMDEYFGYRLGALEYRGLRFEHERLATQNYQGNAVINFTDIEKPYTRIIEHKHFETDNERYFEANTVITREYPIAWSAGEEPYYPINDDRNTLLFQRYLELAQNEPATIFAGRLGTYRYLDMDKVVEQALKIVEKLS